MTSAIRALETAAGAGSVRRSPNLMQKAGTAMARLVLARSSKTSPTVVLAGPGNNGGDAWVAAEALRRAKRKVTVLMLGVPRFADESAHKAMHAYQAAGGTVTKTLPKSNADGLIVVDGLFGIGIGRAPTGAFADVIRAVNDWRRQGRAHVFALDVPSGLVADTGVAFDPTIEADATLTFIAPKPGLYTADGVDHAGEVVVESLGLAATVADGMLLGAATARLLIPTRRRNTHKGTFGSVGIIGGAEGMAGAAVLAARAALHMGPGKVYLGLLDRHRPAFDPLHPELMLTDGRLLAKESTLSAFAVGMGMGDTLAAVVLAVLSADRPAVFDADALNAIASNPSIGAAFQAKLTQQMPVVPFVFTPHPGEAARLLGITGTDVQRDRIAAARAIARRFGVVCVLKGAGTIIAAPDQRYWINTSGNAGMASGGMGDALAGMLAALLAQGLTTLDAALLGVFLHGAAGDAACHHGAGPLGLTASEVIFEARTLFNAGLEEQVHD